MFSLVSFLIVCGGGINWLCIGLFQFDIIAGIFGSQANFMSRFLYMVIGLASLCSLIALPIQKGKIYEPKSSQQAPQSKKEQQQSSTTSTTPTSKQTNKSAQFKTSNKKA